MAVTGREGGLMSSGIRMGITSLVFENDSQGRSEPPKASPMSFSALRRDVVFFIVRLNEWAKCRNLFGFKHHSWHAFYVLAWIVKGLVDTEII